MDSDRTRSGTEASAPGTGEIIGVSDLVLVTGSTGFLGARVVTSLLNRGFRNIRCFTRRSSGLDGFDVMVGGQHAAGVDVIRGNLLSRDDCIKATKDVAVIYHLAAGTGEKSFPDAFMNSVLTTRNLLDAALGHGVLRRFVNVSSFAVYTNRNKPHRGLLDESCPIEAHPERRGEAYCYAKVKQDELVVGYGTKHGIPYVLVRPGSVYGPGQRGITGRVGSGAFGIFLHLGGTNVIPFTYVDNCAEAIVLAGIRKGVDREVLNVVDDDLPTSRQFLRLYKRHVRPFRSIPVPRLVSYLLCAAWEKYSTWSEGQLPPVFNRRTWHAYWKGSRYTNTKLKALLGWTPDVTTAEGLRRYFESCRIRERDVS
jgi:nucleoside-diphosphate-sugar epimerase